MSNIILKRFNHLSDIVDKTFHFSASNTDKTRVVPDIVQSRALLANGLGSTKKQLYDFPNGIDDGSADVASFARQKFISRVVLDDAFKKYLRNIELKYKDDVEKVKEQQEKLKQEYEKISNKLQSKDSEQNTNNQS